MRTLRPGLLVSLKTRVIGGVQHERRDLEAPDVKAGPGATMSRWETTRVVADAAEHEEACRVRLRASGVVRRSCIASDFGLLCPEDAEPRLREAIDEARAGAEAFNDGARHSRVEVHAILGRIAATDDEALRALSGEMRSLLTAMEAGVQALDAEAIREAAARARKLGAMLGPESARRAQEAVEQARTAARIIVRRIEKDGEAAVVVAAELRTDAIQNARMAFLDLDLPAVAPVAPRTDGRAAGLDLPAAEG